MNSIVANRRRTRQRQRERERNRERQNTFFSLHSEPLAQNLAETNQRATARGSDPHTSHQAAQRVNASGTAKNHSLRILQLLGKFCRPSTTHELAELSQTDGGLRLTNAQVHKRMRELCAGGYISDAVTRRCECGAAAVPSCQQKPMTAWTITGKGVAEIQG